MITGPIARLFAFLDANQWACWLGMALCIAAASAVDALV